MSEDLQLFAARVPIFPKDVRGWYRRLKWQIMALTLMIYYVTPWIRWTRGPNMPDQAVLVDLANRRFYFFWIEIWPHEFYFVAGMLVMAGFGLFLFTSALGRVWCGYACPQTVWTDLFLAVERWIEGDRNAQLRLLRAKWSAHKITKRLSKWSIWLIISVATGGAWIFYFTDAPTLLGDLLTLQAHPIAWTTIGILTATTFVFGGFLREQVCIYMCPWPRIQAAMMDESTLTVAYRDWRGEPRGKHRKAADADQLGDCIDCMACVNVCPMGIDIRDGQQMECITCALCIDACDEVMERTGRPRGLIDYLSLDDERIERAGGTASAAWKRILHPRTLVYGVLWGGLGLLLMIALYLRPEIEVSVEAVRNPTYVTLSDGTIRNSYVLRLRNKMGEMRRFAVLVTGDGALSLDDASIGEVLVDADATQAVRLHVVAPPNSAPAQGQQTPIVFEVLDLKSGERAEAETVFHGKEKP